MIRAALTSLLARKLRLLLSAVAVVLGVGFVAGSLIFTDTLGRAFEGITEGTVGDVVVAASESGEGFSTATISAAEVARFEDLDGVARVDGNVEAFGVFVVGENGNVVGGQGAPALAFNHNDAPNQLGRQVVTYDQGRPPEREGEVAIDAQTAERAGLSLGDDVEMVTAGQYPQIDARLVGILEFGEGGVVGASISVFDTKSAQKYFLDGKDVYSSVWLTTTDDAAPADVAKEAAAITPKGYTAETGAAVAERTATQVQEALGFITTFLLVFAGIALLVGSFIIVNTFSILVAQRGRELALLRAIGASRGQITRSVMIEALVVGLVGSTVGLVVGVLLALGIQGLFSLLGLDLSGSGLIFAPRTVVAAYAVGVLVTVLAAYVPARRAGSVAPVEAMREQTSESTRTRPVRLALEVAVLVLGVAAFLVGLFVVDTDELVWVGLGTVGMLLGLAFLSPLVGRPLIRALGWVYRRVFGPIGHMAEQNAIRNPGRTAATASALMIGMTLVALMGVLASSTKATVDQQIADSFRADYVLSNAVNQPFSHTLTTEAAEVPGVAEVSPVRYAPLEVDGERRFVQAVDPATVERIQTIDIQRGDADLSGSTVLISATRAGDLQPGDPVTVSLGGQSRELTVSGIYANPGSQPDVLVSLDTLSALGAPEADSSTFVFLQDGADRAQVVSGLEQIISGQPLVSLKDQADYAAEQRASIDQVLFLIYGLLAMAIVIAVFGIINTLSLSVLERTREIGLLRAVGLSRGQLRRMVRLESVVIALLGAILGIVLGVVAGVAIQRSLVDDGITELAIPWVQIVVFLVLAAIIGVLAALWPAWRASRMDVLRAIGSE